MGDTEMDSRLVITLLRTFFNSLAVISMSCKEREGRRRRGLKVSTQEQDTLFGGGKKHISYSHLRLSPEK